MDKKIYLSPEFEVVELELEAPLLTESDGTTGVKPGDNPTADDGNY